MSLRFLLSRFPIPFALILAALVLNSVSARADVIYTNFGDDNSWSTGTGLIVTHDGAAWSSVAVGFTPSANFNLSSIEVSASDLFGDSKGAVLGIFADDAGHPGGKPLESFHLEGLLGQFGRSAPLMTLTSTLQPLLLADTTYWIGMQGPVGGFIVWNQSASLASGIQVADGSGNWSLSDAPQGVLQIDGVAAPDSEIPIVPPDQPPPDDFPPSASAPPSNTSSNPSSNQGLSQVLNQTQEAPTVIPEPGAAWLLLTGLIVISGAKNRARFTHKK